MGSIQNTVYYCSVSKGNEILYSYSCGDHEIENLAALCLEKTPPFHSWYFETMGKKTFGFLMEDEHVYFTIVDEGLQNPGILQFLEHVRDEFKKVREGSRKGSRGSFSGLDAVCLQEQLVPVIHRLISSLENVSQPNSLEQESQSDGTWTPEIHPSHHQPVTSPTPECTSDAQIEVATPKAPLLGKPNRQEKKKMKDRAIDVRETDHEEHRRSTDRGIKVSVTASEPNHQGKVVSSISVQKGSSSMRIRTSPHHAERMWWRQVFIVIVIDAVVCLVLFVIWLAICGGFQCISN